MNEKFFIAHRYTIIKATEKTWQILNTSKFKHSTFLRKYNEKNFFCGHNILTESGFQTQMSSKPTVEISVWGIVLVMKNCCFVRRE
jgi:hypothetical protein